MGGQWSLFKQMLHPTKNTVGPRTALQSNRIEQFSGRSRKCSVAGSLLQLVRQKSYAAKTLQFGYSAIAHQNEQPSMYDIL